MILRGAILSPNMSEEEDCNQCIWWIYLVEEEPLGKDDKKGKGRRCRWVLMQGRVAWTWKRIRTDVNENMQVYEWMRLMTWSTKCRKMDMFLLTCRLPTPCGPSMGNDSPQNVATCTSYKVGDCSCRLLDSSPPKEIDTEFCGT